MAIPRIYYVVLYFHVFVEPVSEPAYLALLCPGVNWIGHRSDKFRKVFATSLFYTWGCEILSYYGEEGPKYIKVCNKRWFFPCGPTYNISTLNKAICRAV